MPKPQNHWLFKSEPDSFSIHDLAASPRKTTCWDGVRNYQARNSLRDDVQAGDRVLFYHSGGEPAVVGTAVVVAGAYPDHTARDRHNAHYDPKSTAGNPIWMMVDIRLEEIFPVPVPLATLRGVKALAGMELLRRGSRLSIQPANAKHFETIVALGRAGAKASRPAAKRVRR